jgi:ribosomal protein S18 acetylase RimI-like enzyme
VTELQDDLALARRVQENVVATFVLAGRTMAGGRVEEFDGATLVTTGLPLLLFNQVLVVDGAAPEATAAAIRGGVDRFRGFGKRFVVTLRGGIDDAYLPVVEELGLEALPESPWMPGMAMHPLPERGGAALQGAHEIRRVVDSAGLADHADVVAAGFGMPHDWATSFATETLLAVPEATFYVGYRDGVAVTSGLGVRSGRTIGVYNIATVESARRQGLGAAMTMRVVEDGAAAGCDVAILQASEMGLPVYDRLGFRVVSEYFGYVEPGSDD